MIVRLMGEGQFQVADEETAELDRLDNAAVAALEAGDEETFRSRLRDLAERVRANGERLPDDDLHPSDVIVPPDDLSLEEARELFSGEGLIPDTPVA
jgi:hypothetical protein